MNFKYNNVYDNKCTNNLSYKEVHEISEILQTCEWKKISLNPRLKLHIKINVHLERSPLKHKWNDFDHAKIKRQYEYETQHIETQF